MLDAFLNVFTGGATGLVGTGLSMIGSHLQHKRDLHKLELECRRDIARAAAQKEITRLKGEYAALEASLKSEGKRYGIFSVDVVRGLMRPVLTLGCLFGVVMVYFTADNPATPEQETTLQAMIYMATTTIFWWFGSRPIDKAKEKR